MGAPYGGVVIRSVESFGAPKVRASEGSFEVFRGLLGACWGSLGGLLGVFWGVLGGSEAHFGAYTFKRKGGLLFGVVGLC